MPEDPTATKKHKKHSASETMVTENVACGFEIFLFYPVPTCIFSLETGKIFMWNESLDRMFGYPPNYFETFQNSLNTLIDNPSMRELSMQFIVSKSNPNETLQTLITCKTKNNEPRYITLQVWHPDSDFYKEKCAIVHFCDFSISQDVIENLLKQNDALDNKVRQSAGELDQHKQWLEMALEGSKEGLWVIDFQSGKMNFTFTDTHLLGYSREELVDSPIGWDMLTHPADFPEVKRSLNDHFSGKTPYYESEYRALTKTGDWKWILGHGRVIRRDELGNPLEAVGTHVDIDRLKKAEIKLRKSEFQFRTLVENAPIGIVLANDEGPILYLNPEFTALFGYNLAEIPDMSCWWSKAYPDQNYRKEVYENLKIKDGIEPSLAEIICKNDDRKYVNIKMVSLNDNMILLTYDDVTAEVLAEQALKKREQELQEKSEKLEEMNTALRVLLNKRNTDKEEMESKVHTNIRDLILPYLDKLETISSGEMKMSYINIIRANLNNIVSAFASKLIKKYINFTPRELQIANMIKEDMTTKDMAAMLYVTDSSIEFHRHNMRKKLGITDKKINLKTYLRSIL